MIGEIEKRDEQVPDCFAKQIILATDVVILHTSDMAILESPV